MNEGLLALYNRIIGHVNDHLAVWLWHSPIGTLFVRAIAHILTRNGICGFLDDLTVWVCGS